jgi:iron complex outermembrane recepter protein
MEDGANLRKYVLAMATSVAALSAFGPVAIAQEADEAEVEDSVHALDTVYVTAERRQVNLQDTPVPVTAFTEEVISDLDLNDTLQLAQFTPSMIASHNAGLASANSYWLRGLGNSQSVATFDPPVGSYVDEIYIARQNTNNYAFLDTERVEVLRGPQGTLFGRNTTGGAVNVIMKKPGDEFGGKFEANMGSFDRYMFRGTMDMPVSDTVLTKVSGYYLTDDGYLNNQATGDTLNGAENYGVRGDVRFLPNDRITIDLAAEYFQDTGTYLGVIGLPGESSKFETSTTPDFYNALNGLPQTDCDGDPVDILLDEEAGNCALSETYGLNGKISFDATDTGTLEVVFGRRSFDQAYINQYSANSVNQYGGYTLADKATNEQESVEIKWDDSVLDGRLRYVTGFFYLDETSDFDTSAFAGSDSYNFLTSNRFTHDVMTAAYYLQGDYDFAEKWTLTLGARYTHEKKNLAFWGSDEVDGMGFMSADVLAEGIPLEIETNKVTPRIALTYKPNDDLMLFASATNGFKSGGWNGNAPAPNRVLPFDEENTWSYELGAKSELMNRRLRLNGNIYYSETDDLQVTSGVILPGETAIVSLARNAGKLEVSGFEFETAYVFNEYLSAFLNGSIMDGKYASVVETPGVPADLQVTTSTEPVRTPDFQAALGVTHEYPVEFLSGDIRTVFAYRHSEPYYVATLNTARAPQEDYIDLAVGYTHETGDWGLEVRGTNLTEQETISANFLSLFPGQPRRVNMKVWFKF